MRGAEGVGTGQQGAGRLLRAPGESSRDSGD